MNHCGKSILSENNFKSRELQVSSSSDESETNGNKNYSFVNTEKRCPHDFEETNLNSNAPAETLRDAEKHRPLNLSPVEKNIFLKVSTPENKRIRFHSHSDGELFTERDSKHYQIHLTHELKVQPKIVSNINIAECSDCGEIQNLLENVLKEREIVNSEFNLTTNDSHDESQETNYSQNSSIDNESPENSLSDFMKVPEIILEKLKSLENVIDQERREKGTSDHIKKLFPLYLRSSDSGSELYTKREIYLKDLCKKKSSKSNAVVDNRKSGKIVKINHRSQENNNSKENLTIDENNTLAKETKIPKFEIRCQNLQTANENLVSPEENISTLEKNDLLANNSETIETKTVDENLVSPEENISTLEKNDLLGNNSEIIETKENSQDEELNLSFRDEEKTEISTEEENSDDLDDSVCILDEINANTQVSPTGTFVNIRKQKKQNFIEKTENIDKNLTYSVECYQNKQSSLDNEKLSPKYNSTNIAHKDSILLTRKNLMQKKFPDSLEESISDENKNSNLSKVEEDLREEEEEEEEDKKGEEEDDEVDEKEEDDEEKNKETNIESDSGIGTEELETIVEEEEKEENKEINIEDDNRIVTEELETILEEEEKEENNEINIENDSRIVDEKLETIFEKSSEEKTSSQSREKSQEAKNDTTSEDVEENRIAETQNSNSFIINNVIVNRTSGRTILQIPLQINENSDSIMEITLKIKCGKTDSKNEGNKTLKS
ncbi:DNA ligase 1-like [Leptopilina heterotoma]|uniref:DNA ligase 1-like n=1 Tax=Leptopilina heterotoma TaxID=63436 RepID=UPI001CA99AB2|nr:DNA ligase 1-like [Leptopilina heterotoma]